jgi:hypothetical protein
MTDVKKVQLLDLNLLKVFESIYQEQNMSRAADVLHITPSAVSHALKGYVNIWVTRCFSVVIIVCYPHLPASVWLHR